MADVTSSVEQITPVEARNLLDRNTSNRNIRPANLERLKTDIREGRFVMNGEPIIIADTGEINDGQHRLLACVETGIPITVLVVRGVDRDTRFTVDVGDQRRVGDMLTIKGYKNVLLHGRIAALLLTDQNYGRIERGGDGANRSQSKAQILEYAEVHRKEIEWAIAQCYHTDLSFATYSVLSYFVVLAARVCPRHYVEQFIHALRYGDGEAKSAVSALRSRLMRHRAHQEKLTPHTLTEALTRAFNLWGKKKPTGRILTNGKIPPIKYYPDRDAIIQKDTPGLTGDDVRDLLGDEAAETA